MESHEEVQLDRDKRDERQFKTRLLGGVEVVVKDPEFVDQEEFPLTLPPRLVKDRFAVERNTVRLK